MYINFKIDWLLQLFLKLHTCLQSKLINITKCTILITNYLTNNFPKVHLCTLSLQGCPIIPVNSIVTALAHNFTVKLPQIMYVYGNYFV